MLLFGTNENTMYDLQWYWSPPDRSNKMERPHHSDSRKKGDRQNRSPACIHTGYARLLAASFNLDPLPPGFTRLGQMALEHTVFKRCLDILFINRRGKRNRA